MTRSAALEVPFARPDVGEAELAGVAEVLASGWLTSGPHARRFEERFAERVGAKHAVAVSSCTAALHLSLAALDPRPGEAVLLPTYNFTAAGEVVQHLGLEPVLVDSEPGGLQIDPGRLEEALTGSRRRGHRVRAVIPVHLAGHPCDLAAIDALAEAHGIEVVEDAAHALPAAWRGVPIGARRASGQPRAVCYSFYASKTLTTGEGGMIATDDGELAERCRRLSLHGIDSGAWRRERRAPGTRPSADYEVLEAGYKYNLSDVAAALGLAQLDKLEAMRARRAEVARRYGAALAGHGAVELPAEPARGDESAWHLYLLRLRLDRFAGVESARDRLAEALRRRGVGTSVHYRPLHLHRHYRRTLGHAPEDFPVALREWRRVISLPIYSALTDRQVEHVSSAIQESLTELANP